ncbi:hypothetical protein RWE15_23935 [Virgibacillus halophilus]|uniref:Transposase DDE domain-containing protein n=1 Tax=Tigheibacillus halophilus TaxID=361280 RepID=A0ABU5CE43_9BACI|nr:hypothetical protein [Virgibacillus halophilus]
MGFWDKVIGRNKEIIIVDDKDLYDSDTEHTSSKRMAIESVIGFIARIIIQSEFRIKKRQ